MKKCKSIYNAKELLASDKEEFPQNS